MNDESNRRKSGCYKGKALEALKKAECEVGDIISVANEETTYEGILIPSSEYGADSYIVVKLKSGYNIGVHVTPTTKS